MLHRVKGLFRDARTEFGRDILLFSALATMTACSSVPDSRYYTLDMNQSGTVEAPFQIEAGRFHANDALSKPEILIQATPTQIEYYALDQWASDLSEMIREKLQLEFGPAAAPKFRVEGDILGFEQVDREGGADARVKLRIRAYDALESRSSEPVFRKTYEESSPAAQATADEVVSALSDSLEVIAVQIAHDLGTL